MPPRRIPVAARQYGNDEEYHRSDPYQYLMCEVQVDRNFYEGAFSNNDAAVINNNYSEEYITITEQITSLVMKLCREQFTERQLCILQLLLKGYTQHDIAKHLKLNQATIQKSIMGDERNGGGIVRRMKVILIGSEEYRKLLNELVRLHD